MISFRHLFTHLALLALPSAAWAQTYTWTNNAPGTQSWHVAGNWSPAAVPPPGADVIIPAGTNTISVSTADVSVASLNAGRNLTIAASRSLEATVATFDAQLSLNGGSTLTANATFSPGSTLALPAYCNAPARIANSTLTGDVQVSITGGRLRLSNTTFINALVFSSSTASTSFYGEVAIDPDTTFAGTIRNTTGADLYVVASAPGTITFAPGSIIEGRDIEFRTTGPQGCTAQTPWSMVNHGTIRQTISGAPIEIRVPIIDSDLTLGGAIALNSNISNSTVTIAPASMIDLPAYCNPPAMFANSTFVGDLQVSPSGGRLRLSNTTFNNALIFSGSTASVSFYGEVSIDPGTTFAGTIRNTTGADLFFTAADPGVVTFAPGSVIEGRDIQFRATGPQGCTAETPWSMVNFGTIRQNISGAPIEIRVPIIDSDLTLGGSLALTSSIVGSNVTMAPGSMVDLPAYCNPPAFFSNSTFLGDLQVSPSGGRLRLSNAVFNNALVFSGSTASVSFFGEVSIDPGTAFFGTLRNTTSADLFVIASAPGTVTIAQGSVIEGTDIQFRTTGPQGCTAETPWSLINLGTVRQNLPGSPISINVPLINLGAVTGNVTNPNGTTLPPYTSAAPTQTATVPADRNDPPPSSNTTFSFQNLVLEDDTYFGLGPNETLNLDNGNGTLVIGQGATFSGNGLIFGNVINQGLLRIPITRVPTLPNIVGGVTTVFAEPSFGLPVYIPVPEPIRTQPQTLFTFSGSGSGGAPGGGPIGGGSSGTFASGGGHYVLDTPAVTFQGTTGWDGELEVTGTFEQTDTGFLRLFIAGPEQGETYSLLRVGQEATIAGTVQIVLDPLLLGFTPSVGDAFDMIVAAGGATAAPSLAVQTLATADGASALGLTLEPFDSPFLMDPDDLVIFPVNIFDMTLVNEGTTLRFTLNQPICAPQPIATTSPACGRDTAEFTVPNAGSGPFTFQWQIEDAPDSDTWSDLTPGFYEGLGTVLTPTERSLGIRKPRFLASGTRFRCIITNPCDTIATAPAAMAVLDQTEEACGNCPICEADFDDNGGIDGGDLAAFFIAFEEGALCADVDRNGGVDGGDLATFFTLFEAGGCD